MITKFKHNEKVVSVLKILDEKTNNVLADIGDQLRIISILPGKHPSVLVENGAKRMFFVDTTSVVSTFN